MPTPTPTEWLHAAAPRRRRRRLLDYQARFVPRQASQQVGVGGSVLSVATSHSTVRRRAYPSFRRSHRTKVGCRRCSLCAIRLVSRPRTCFEWRLRSWITTNQRQNPMPSQNVSRRINDDYHVALYLPRCSAVQSRIRQSSFMQSDFQQCFPY